VSIPETTSAEGLERYVGGKCLFHSNGEAWRDIKAWIVALPPIVDTLHLPSVSEPFLAWSISGEVDFQEQENKRPWLGNRTITYLTYQEVSTACGSGRVLASISVSHKDPRATAGGTYKTRPRSVKTVIAGNRMSK